MHGAVEHKMSGFRSRDCRSSEARSEPTLKQADKQAGRHRDLNPQSSSCSASPPLKPVRCSRLFCPMM